MLVASSLFGRSLGFLLAAILAAALVFALVGLAVLGSVSSYANESSLRRAASALAAAFPSSGADLAATAAGYAAAASRGGYRVTIILPDGRVIADSEADPRSMENHASRPEVAAVLAEGLAGAAGTAGTAKAVSSRRQSATLGEELMYAAAPIMRRGEPTIAAVLRLALHRPSLEQALVPARWTLALASFLFILAAIGAAAGFGRMMARPLASIARAAGAYGRGEGSSSAAAVLRPGDPEEIRLLAATLDGMAGEIDTRVLAAKAQGRELEAILDAIAEAVLALDGELKITRANPAAAELFGLKPPSATAGTAAVQARGLLEATRSSALQAVAADCLASGEPRKAELSLFLPGERIFQAFAAPLGPSSTPGTSLVIVLNDITELRRLERVRRDFVANVSHELRTPVQMVKGFAESLRDGGLEQPNVARRFVGIIERNAARMESLIGDLLSLASLEREGRDWLKAERKDIRPIIDSALEALGPKAEARGTILLVECGEALAAKIDPGLLEQALINLIDNAVKYSPPKSTVQIRARTEGPDLVIEVQDRGLGIPARDLPRLFERFYRVDRARSREQGGTGLGLAIVRHIAIAHGGSASVESWEGEGSTFRLTLPLG